jgi:Xaa-Pro dipeptidase
MDAKELEELHRAHVSRLAADTARALQKHGFDALVIHSGTPLKWMQPDDNYWPLRTMPEFRHWAPLNEAGCAVVVETGRKPRLLRPTERSFWEAPAPPESNHFWSSFDVTEVPSASAMRELMPKGRVAFLGDDLAAAASWGIGSVNPPELVSTLDQLRVHKTPYEVACIVEANRRAAAGHEELRKLFAGADRSELELHLAFLAATRQDDAETPYKNIVALGAHAATLHHVSYAKRSEPAQSMLVDAGAAFAGYASDITRTWVKGKGAGGSAFAQLVVQVEAMQQRLCAQARTGLHYEALHDESHRQVGGILREVGVVKRTAEDPTASGITRAFYPHGLGHSLGLQVHDVGCATTKPRPDNPFLRNTTVISENQCFTIEPGIYFIESLLRPLREGPRANDVDWKLVDALAAFGGVRIEDDVVAGAQGVRNLTREALPKGGGAI